ncbi:uncharacterized protein [Argopecten irradians]|uniref:uncharacterized protein isoform X2 n=1 Tax=Argopecten irradians TaxID=31199 RepID=UPI003722C38E
MLHYSYLILTIVTAYHSIDDSTGSVACVRDTSVLFHNLSLNKPASLSSLYEGSAFYDIPAGYAWRANDGNDNPNYIEGSCSHTAPNEDTSWWQVDLQQQYDVISVSIVNRGDSGFGYRLSDFGIEISMFEQDDGTGHLTGAVLCHFHEGGGIGDGEERVFPCTNGSVGRYLRVYMRNANGRSLALCEVKVSGFGMICAVPNTSSATVSHASSTSSTSIDDVNTLSSLISTDVTSQASPNVALNTSSACQGAQCVNATTTTCPGKQCVNTTTTPCPVAQCCRYVNRTVPTMSELTERLKELKMKLTIDRKRTSFYRRKLVCAGDSRKSARNLGSVFGVGVLVSVFGCIIAMDLPRLKSFITSVCRK